MLDTLILVALVLFLLYWVLCGLKWIGMSEVSPGEMGGTEEMNR